MIIRMREKGQITIPIELCKVLNLVKDSALSIIQVGEGILISPKHFNFDEISLKFSKASIKKGIKINDLLKDLKKIRKYKV